jgi:hypothetical protein
MNFGDLTPYLTYGWAGTRRNMENNALSSLRKLLRNQSRGGGGGCFTPSPPLRFRNNLCKDDGALFSRSFHGWEELQLDSFLLHGKLSEKTITALIKDTRGSSGDKRTL